MMHRLTRRELKMLRDAAADKYHTTSGAAQRDYGKRIYEKVDR